MFLIIIINSHHLTALINAIKTILYYLITCNCKIIINFIFTTLLARYNLIPKNLITSAVIKINKNILKPILAEKYYTVIIKLSNIEFTQLFRLI
jgi:hypothetical protein